MAKAGKDGKMPAVPDDADVDEEDDGVSKIDKLGKSGKEGKKGKHAKASKHGKIDKTSKAPGVLPRRRKKKRKETFAIYIYKVLRQIHSDIGISKRGMGIMNSFMQDIFDRMATESTKLLRTDKKRTLSSREIETAARLMLPGELSKHAVSEGTKAVTKYTRM
mmetsp:Transcript_56949/g.161584  ORF Transcript_56949/g.161584 Transcript_56949/m.161584 type:complete len:163 (+) Transcript_56949:101-589(+)